MTEKNVQRPREPSERVGRLLVLDASDGLVVDAAEVREPDRLPVCAAQLVESELRGRLIDERSKFTVDRIAAVRGVAVAHSQSTERPQSPDQVLSSVVPAELHPSGGRLRTQAKRDLTVRTVAPRAARG